MKLLEYKAHELFGKVGIPCSQGRVVKSMEEVSACAGALSYPIVIKAQVETGGRGKAGGVKVAKDRDELLAHAAAIFALRIGGQGVSALFLTGKKDIAREYYLSIVLDRRRKCPMLIFSAEGGIEINETAEKHPEKVIKVALDRQIGIEGFTIQYLAGKTGVDQGLVPQLEAVVRGLYRLFLDYDCLLAEINPLVLDTSGSLVALDGKVEIDDNSLFRHPDMSAFRDEICSEPLVLTARKSRFLYIPVEEAGNIAVISNGSGMIMSSIDLLSRGGQKTCCALDLGGGATADRIYEAVRIVLSNTAVKLVLINIFGGITRCDEVATGVVRAVGECRGLPFVMRMEGTNKEQGIGICSGARGTIELVDGLGEAIAAIGRLLPVHGAA